jgi:hypothetical protein
MTLRTPQPSRAKRWLDSLSYPASARMVLTLTRASQRAKQQPPEAVQIDHRPERGEGAQDQVCGAVTDQLQLGEGAVAHQFFNFRAAFATFDEVAAGARCV